ncbi:MAG TPA: OadG family transporter subunit [Pseudomonadales bacterium]|jgi:oxaloacetate decarboxylase gamma subunit|nr:hypothetical protein [Gammaproteobacteria bacterium]MDP6024427.1 OadG family transporter subunit [Pseudomonadales bacterium]MDP7452301.1 OadG family transporter subunit [Arenicellales bacterium]MDP7315679.1 OadG family transporter subunit [Pseudomonadales bacterium]HJL61324.1 OadG family transporter subunit [Pseudomonadales bacterium]|tara:strand:- start:2737 stop:2955 length:219 start_codon:yes stop_codon:yes gene_type:complete
MSAIMSQALDLVLYGMGTVFVFLTILVAVTILMSYLVNISQDLSKALVTESADPKKLAAIAAAVRLYRQSHE